MFGSYLRANENKRIAALQKRIEELEADNNRLRTEQLQEIKDDVQSSTFVVDWSKLEAFSLERMGDVRDAYTVIGYWSTRENGSKTVQEWKFYCSKEQHEKLAKEFEKIIKK